MTTFYFGKHPPLNTTQPTTPPHVLVSPVRPFSLLFSSLTRCAKVRKWTEAQTLQLWIGADQDNLANDVAFPFDPPH
jgi:hypothetical protein